MVREVVSMNSLPWRWSNTSLLQFSIAHQEQKNSHNNSVMGGGDIVSWPCGQASKCLPAERAKRLSCNYLSIIWLPRDYSIRSCASAQPHRKIQRAVYIMVKPANVFFYWPYLHFLATVSRLRMCFYKC